MQQQAERGEREAELQQEVGPNHPVPWFEKNQPQRIVNVSVTSLVKAAGGLISLTLSYLHL